jgi:lipopolysaccharide transport protein LptA
MEYRTASTNSASSALPATHYIVSMQIALLAASAAYLQSDLRPPKGGMNSRAQSGVGVAGMIDADEDPAALWGLPEGGIKRFALAEQVLNDEGMGTRVMGRAVGGGMIKRAFSSLGAEEVADQPPVAMPIESALPSGEVGLAESVGAEMAFEPVPNGVGYSITADAASHFDLESKSVVFSGNVALINESFTLKARRLVIHLDGEGGQMKQLVANGEVEVTLTQGAPAERFRGWSEEAVFEPGQKSLVMRGWPRILGDGREHRAAAATTKMTIHLRPNKLVTEGRSQTRILPATDVDLLGGKP